MIHQTVLPLELVFEGADSFSPEYHRISFSRGQIIVEPVSKTTGRIVQLMSYDLRDYLDPRFQPGALIEICMQNWK